MAAAAATTQPVLPDEILEEIFLRLDDAADLARAACACASFRRVVSARNFVRRFRSLHPAPVVGVFELETHGAFRPAGPPHRSAPAARALAQAADFTFSFLPKRYTCVSDARDGLVLLCLVGRANYTGFVELVVCDPLHRRYVQIPRIPDDLAAATGVQTDQPGLNAFFDPAGKDHKEEENLSFRLISGVFSEDKLVTFHFSSSSATGEWRAQEFPLPMPLYPPLAIFPDLFKHHCAHGCFFWTSRQFSSFFFMLDMCEMKLSLVDLPRRWPLELTIVEAREGVLGVLCLGHGVLNLYCKALRSNGVDPEEWKHEKIIPMPELDSVWHIISAAEGYALLQATPLSQSAGESIKKYFTLDLKTFLVERLCMFNRYIGAYRANLYTSFPPLLSLPSL